MEKASLISQRGFSGKQNLCGFRSVHIGGRSYALLGRFAFHGSNVKVELVIFDLQSFAFYHCYCIQVFLKHANDLGILRDEEFALFDCVVNHLFHPFILTLIAPDAPTTIHEGSFCRELREINAKKVGP